MGAKRTGELIAVGQQLDGVKMVLQDELALHAEFGFGGCLAKFLPGWSVIPPLFAPLCHHNTTTRTN